MGNFLSANRIRHIVLVALLLFAWASGQAETINIDFNTNGADTIHAAANGVFSRGGALWNSVVSTNPVLARLVTEYGRTTSVAFASSGTTVPGFRSGFTNRLQDTGFTVSFTPTIHQITNLDASLQWDLAVYLSTNEAHITVDNLLDYSQTQTNAAMPTGELPGIEGADYLLFTNIFPTYLPTGVGCLRITVMPDSDAQLGGLQLRPSPVQIPRAATTCVAPGGGHVYPYTNWADAATNLQAAITNPSLDHAVILVSNGVYSGPGLNGAVCCVGSDYAYTYTLRSVNGPEHTIIDGLGYQRCLHVTDNSLVEGFTLRNEADDPYLSYDVRGGGLR